MTGVVLTRTRKEVMRMAKVLPLAMEAVAQALVEMLVVAQVDGMVTLVVQQVEIKVCLC